MLYVCVCVCVCVCVLPVPESDRPLYELRFAERTGENYSLCFSPEHRWYYRTTLG